MKPVNRSPKEPEENKTIEELFVGRKKSLKSKNVVTHFQDSRPTVFKTRLRRKVSEKQIKTVEEFVKCDIKEPETTTEFFNNLNQKLEQRVLLAQPVGHMKQRGKVLQHRVIVGIGNKQGVIGLGSAKSDSFNVAVKKASNKARRNLVYLRCQEVNNQEPYYGPYTETTCKKGATRVTVRPLTGSSITASDRGQEYCNLGNFTNILIEVGSKGRKRKGKINSFFNYYMALHQCLKQQMRP